MARTLRLAALQASFSEDRSGCRQNCVSFVVALASRHFVSEFPLNNNAVQPTGQIVKTRAAMDIFAPHVGDADHDRAYEIPTVITRSAQGPSVPWAHFCGRLRSDRTQESHLCRDNGRLLYGEELAEGYDVRRVTGCVR